MRSLDWIVVGFFFLLIVGIAIWASRQIKGTSDFFTAGGKMPWWLSGISHHMAGYSAAVFVAYAEVAYKYGFTIYVWWAIPISISCFLGAIFIAPRWSRLRMRLHIQSPMEYLAIRYNVPTQQLMAWSGTILKVFDVGAKWAAIAVIINVFTGIPTLWGILVAGVIAMFYTTVGGLWADALIDFAQFFVQLIAGIAMFIIVAVKLGGLSSIFTLWDRLPPGHSDWLAGPYNEGFIAAYLLITFLSYNGGTWNLAQRYIASPTGSTARKAALLSSALYLIWPLVLFFPMWAAPIFYPDLADPTQSYSTMAMDMLPPGLVGLVLASMFAHTLSMTASDSNAITAVVTRDILPRLWSGFGRMSQKVSLRAARITTLTFMALTWIIAIKASAFGGILSLLVLWFGAMVGPISIAMLLGLLPAFRHSGPAAANAGLVAGLLAFAYVKYGMADASMAVTIGIPVLVSAVVYIGIGLLTRGITPRREVLDLLNAIGSDETACDNPIPRQKAQCFDTTKNGDEGDELTRYIPQYFSLLIPKLRRDAALVASCENGTRPEGRDMSDLKAFYRDHLTKVLLPFWQRAFDQRNGGVFTCFTNGGEQLLSKDKFTWSQGRLVWLLSHLAELHAKGLVSGDAGLWQRQAAQTVAFLRDHAFMPNGNCAFLLSETGEWKETVPGEGYDVSFYADCFVILGFSEYARVFQDQSVLVDALALYRSVEKRLAVGSVRSEPYPIPSGYRPHSFSMIMLHVTEQLHAALASNSRFRLEAEFIAATCDRYLREIMETFWKSDGRVTEIEKSDGRRDTILARHFNPGHTLECMWFVLRAANKLERPEYVPKALAAVAKAFELGWDERYGGLLRFVDLDGGSPRGNSNGDPYEQLIVSTWDTKLWWPHSEALYTTLLAHQLSGSPAFLALYEKTHDYVFSVFPHPDAAVGEWIQIRDRGGTPLEKVVALPVKDPYHILRNVMLILELLDGDPFGSQAIQENERQ